MGKVRKVKRHQKFNYNKDRKKNRKKAKEVPAIKCEEIKKAWDVTKSVKKNLEDMGIAADANKVVKMPKSKPLKMGTLDVEMEVDLQKTPIKKFVMNELEERSKIPGKKKMSMSDEDAGFCVYMMDTYGDNYKAMARDERNYYQETPKQIQRKINRFKSIPEMYKIYAEAREDCPAPPEKANSAAQRLPLVNLSPTRYATRWSDACRRNGHYISPSEPRVDCVYAPDAALCRVRRRLQFGRKPPKDRTQSSSDD